MKFVESSHRAYESIQTIDLGNDVRSNTPMHPNPDELKTYLMETDEEFRRLANQHCQFKKQIEAYASRSFLTPEEQIEETRIKKLKLKLKDQMQEIIDRYRHQHQMA